MGKPTKLRLEIGNSDYEEGLYTHELKLVYPRRFNLICCVGTKKQIEKRHNKLRRAILAYGDENVHLILSDWLEERGFPEAAQELRKFKP